MRGTNALRLQFSTRRRVRGNVALLEWGCINADMYRRSGVVISHEQGIRPVK